MHWASSQGVSPSAARSGRARQGRVRYGLVGRGLARATDGGTEGSSLPAILTDGRWPGEARHGVARLGLAWHGKGHRRWHRDLRGSLPSSTDGRRSGTAGHGAVRQGSARLGKAGQGPPSVAMAARGYSPRCLHCAQLCGLKIDCSRVHRRWQHGPVG